MPRDFPLPLTSCPFSASVVTLAAQDPAPPAQLEPFRTEVNYIRVDMYPTADGKPVIGSAAGRDRNPRRRRTPENRSLRARTRPRRAIAGRHGASRRRSPRCARRCRTCARACSCCSSTPSTSSSARRINIKSPLIQSLNQLIGGDDLVAVMTAGMQARDITFRRRTTSIEELLKGVWSERDHRLKRSAEEG